MSEEPKEEQTDSQEESKKEEEKGITIKKEENIQEWYQQVVLKGELADFSPVKGFMVIRPDGYAIWQRIMDYFNIVLKEMKVKNAYFPLLIPESFFKKEAEHAEGFAPELAFVLRKDDEKDRLAIRPTSETIMYDSYGKWIRSWRDLPLKINQWCNVLRWEVSDVKLFLRSREFLWQEGHCVYATEDDCEKDTKKVLDEYKRLAEELLAVPVLSGKKTEKEKFPGAKTTYAIESFTPEGKALQLGTSHNLGQGFARVFDIQFVDKNEDEKTPWQNSWGISTRMIGAIVMQHADDKGLVLPPRVAEHKVVIVPIMFKGKDKAVLEKARDIRDKLKQYNPILDDRDEYSPGWKFNEWEMKGIPIRIEIGPRDLLSNQVIVVRRDTGQKQPISIGNVGKLVNKLLNEIHVAMFTKAKDFLDSSIIEVEDFETFEKVMKSKKLAKGLFCGKTDCENQIKEKTQGTSRCIPLDEDKKQGKCIHCNADCDTIIIFGKTY
tara:strand:- start:39 stop:1517 length:1479 start_codon:yes stop_codon:yes gene_type:complete